MKHILIAILALACTKQYTAPAFWDVSIARKGDTLTAVAYNTKSTNLRYIWFVNDARSEGKTIVVSKSAYVQLSVLDDKGGSISEYLNFVK